MFSLARRSCAFRSALLHHCSRHRHPQLYPQALFSSSDGKESTVPPPMANLYQEWSLEQDRVLWTNKNKSSAELASLLGRGIRGVQARLSKLKDVNSSAYERLFRGNVQEKSSSSKGDHTSKKLIPVGEVLRRVQWDYLLDASDFVIQHYDRVEDSVIESPMDAPNESIAGEATLLSEALPDHRIVGIKYKERVVWDRANKLDLFFGEPGIMDIIENYEQWKEERDQVQAWNRQRQKLVADRIQQILGPERYKQLQDLSSDLQRQSMDPTIPIASEIESYIKRSLELFRQVRNDPSLSRDPNQIPTSDILALEDFSELVAVLPDALLRELLLNQISLTMDRFEGKNSNEKNKKAAVDPKLVLQEDDLTETFVRGSGPGGQKINKTSNRVILIHEPTQLRVECQDTRSLQQNRKIARKRLLAKLDEHWNGSQSKIGMKQKKVSNKKKKTKAKNRARLRKKQQEKQQQEQEEMQSSSSGTAWDNTDFY